MFVFLFTKVPERIKKIQNDINSCSILSLSAWKKKLFIYATKNCLFITLNSFLITVLKKNEIKNLIIILQCKLTVDRIYIYIKMEIYTKNFQLGLLVVEIGMELSFYPCTGMVEKSCF